MNTGQEGGPRIVGKKEDFEHWGRIRVVFIHKHMTVANIPKPTFLRIKLDFQLQISYI